MSWITVRYFPGFAEDLTSWETSIDQDGNLSQTVRRGERTEHLSTRLSTGQIAKLRELIAATDFAAINAASSAITMDDAESCEVKVFEGNAVTGFDEPLLSWSCIQKHFDEQLQYDPPWSYERSFRVPVTQFALSSALRLWHAVDILSPHGLHSQTA